MAFVKIMWICGYILAVGVDLPLKQIWIWGLVCNLKAYSRYIFWPQNISFTDSENIIYWVGETVRNGSGANIGVS
jgi:hypothetical protein